MDPSGSCFLCVPTNVEQLGVGGMKLSWSQIVKLYSGESGHFSCLFLVNV